MITLPLKLIPDPLSRQTPTAWFIPGGDVAAWLSELSRWQVPHVPLRLGVAPRAFDDPRPAGLLVLGDGLSGIAPSPRCTGLAEVVPGLWIAVDGKLVPAAGEDELRACFSADRVTMWHPATGLVAFEPGDLLRVADLLTTEVARRGDWTRAVPGIALPDRMTHLLAVMPPSADQMMEQFRDEIGDRGDELDSLPPSPRELTGNPLGRVGEALRYGMAKLARRLTGGSSERASRAAGKSRSSGTGGLAGEGWAARVRQWARRTIQHYSTAIQAQRNKEVSRLLNLLESDPDRGLKYALPLSTLAAARGIAPPSSRLGPRDVNFRLSLFGGGGPVDPWELPIDYHQELIRKYRELANREIGLGRYRRAAYILAELLGDVAGAAGALKTGGHWQEAATLYLDRLNNPRAAAECFQQAGLLDDAIRLYVELGEFVTAGDLYTRLDQPEQARRQYRQAVDRLTAAGDYVAAARVIERKLRCESEALELLASGWPYSYQAKACLAEWYQLAARLGRHEQAAERTERLRRDSVSPQQGDWLVDVLADVSQQYPDQPVRDGAADATRVLAGTLLPAASPIRAQRLTAAVARTLPSDLLLGRDCHRFARGKQVATPRRLPAPIPAPRESVGNLEPTRVVQLPPVQAQWLAAVAEGDVVFAVGLHQNQLILARIGWEDRVWTAAPPTWLLRASDGGPRVRLDVRARRGRFDLDVHVVGIDELPHRQPAKCHFAPDCVATFHSEPRHTFDVRYDEGMVYCWSAENKDSLILATGRDGTYLGPPVLFRLELELSSWQDLSHDPKSLLIRDQYQYLAWGEQFFCVKGGQVVGRYDLPYPILDLAGSLPKTRTRIALAMTEGVAIYWGGYEGGQIERVASDMPRPIVCFTRRGRLLIACPGRGEIYRSNQKRLELERTFSPPGTPVAILSGPGAGKFVVLSEDGSVAFFDQQ